MKKTKKHYVEGVILKIPLRYDKKSGRYIEEYSDFIKETVYTPEGYPIMLTLDDACAFGEQREIDQPLIDCGSCRFYRQAENALIGVCIQEKKRKI